MRVSPFLFLALLASVAGLSNPVLSFDPTTISETAVYSISFTNDNTIPGNSVMKFTFPSEVTISDSASVACTVVSQIYNPSSSGVSCSVASRVFTVNGIFGTTPDEVEPKALPITVNLPGVINPSSTKKTVNSVDLAIYSSDNVVVESLISSDNLRIAASAAYLSFASITPTSNVIGAQTTWTFTITTSYTIPASSYIQVSFPFWNSYIGATTSNDLQQYIRVANPSSNSVSNIDSPLSSTFTTSTRVLEIRSGFVSSKTGTVSWSVSNIFNPPTSDSINEFTILIYDSNGNQFLTTSSALTVKVSTPNTIEIKNNAFSATNSTVATTTSGFLSFMLANPTYASVILEITFPSEIVVGSSASVTGVTNIRASGLAYTISSNTIKITNAWTTYTNMPSVSIKIDPITTASSTTPTGTFTITTKSPNGNAIDTGSGGSVSAKVGFIYQYLSSPLVTAHDLTVGASTTYVFDMWISHPIPSGGAIIIIFPSEISVSDRPSSTSCTSVIIGLNSAAKCQVSSRVVTVIGGFTSEFPSGRVSFTLDGVTNPSSNATTSTFRYYSSTSSAGTYFIDSKITGITFTSAPASLVSAQVTPGSFITGEVSTYTFVVVTKNTITTNGYLKVWFPSEIAFSQLDSGTERCSGVQGFPTSTTCSISSSVLTVLGFSSSSFLPGTLQWTVRNVKNAYSTAPSSSFTIVTYDSSGNVIDMRTSGILVTLTTANIFASASVTPSSVINGQLCTYTVALKLKNITPSASYIILEAPGTVTIPSSPSCSVVSGISSVICSFESSTSLKAVITSSASLAEESTISFSIASVKNPGTTKSTDSFKVYSFTSGGFKIDKKESGVTLATTTAATISTITIAAEDPKIAATTNYIITYVPMNTHPSGTVLFITIPNQFTLGTVTCSKASSVLSDSMNCLVSGRSVTVSSAFASDVSAAFTISLKLTGFTNPTSQITTSQWVVSSVTFDNFLIDRSDTITSSFSCDPVCLTCTTLPSTCTSCSSSSGYPYLYDSSCFASCKDGFTDETSTDEKVCVQCSSICKTCSGTISKCTSCSSSSGYPYLYSNTCNDKCLSGYWGDGSVCTQCTNPCKTCSSSTTCLTCDVLTSTGKQTFLHLGTCYETCPDGYTGNSATNVCDQCTGLCKTCSTTTSTCTSCVSPYKLQGTICVSKCIADGTYIETATSCNACVSPCYTCEGDTTTCKSCIADYYLYVTSCTQTCPAGWVAIYTKCRQCSSPCEECKGSQSTCTTCIDGHYLQISTCVTSCSPGYYLSGYECAKCDPGCATCSGGSTLCTSCTNPKYLLSSSCVTSCPTGQYVPSTGVCNACASPCVTCSGNVNNCLSCTSGMFLYAGTCVSQCTADITVLIGTECQTCNTNCKTCSGSVNTCTSCNNNYYLEDGRCVDSCSFGYIFLNNQCSKCNSACFTCSVSTSNCNSCEAGKYLYETTCVSNCPQNFVASGKICVEIIDSGDCNTGCTSAILNNNDCDNVCNVFACTFDNGYCNMTEISCGSGKYLSGTTCSSCVYPCSNCVSTSTTCTSCKPDASTGNQQYLYNNNCYPKCPTKTYQTGLACADCDLRCATCALSSSTCTSCVSPFKLYNNQCVVNCPGSTSVQIDSQTCSDCSSNCKYCSVTFDSCTACNPGMVLQGTTCVSYCSSGYYDDSGVCKICSGCKECSGTATTCTSCSPGTLVYEGKCISSCPIGTYASTSTCEKCSSSCFSCSEASSCDTCPSGSYLFSGACVLKCPTGYVDSSGVCIVNTTTATCSSGCSESLLTNGKCDSLCDNSACNFDNLDCGTYGTCGSGKFTDSNNLCVDCIYPCKQCTSETSCRSCQKSITTGLLLLLKGTSCVEQADCNNGYTQVGVYCSKCDTNCKTCLGSVTTCMSCESGLYLNNGACVESCTSLYTVALGTNCIPCSTNCLTCSGSYDKCLSCPTGKVLEGTTCVSSCSSGYTTTSNFPNTCQACTGDCLTCLGQTYTCTSCKNGKFLYGTSCISQCPDSTTVLIGSSCLLCTSPCMNCENSVTQCTVCVSGYSLYETKCLENCPSGYESRLGICTAYCAEGCTKELLYNSVCDKFCNVDECLKDNGSCETPSVCSVGQYLEGTVCTACVDPCNTCSSSTYCLSCKVGTGGIQMLLYDGKCYPDCPNATYKSGIQCKACDSNCASCSGSSTTCTSCPTGKKLYNGVCKTSCPIATTVESSGVCLDCDDNCKECSGTITTCTKCPSGAVLSSNTCISECPAGYTTTSTSNGGCVACVGCKTCLGSEAFCTSCNTGLYLHENQCLESCPPGFTIISTFPSKCSACSSNCAQCQSKIDHCTACTDGKSLNSYNQCQVAATCPNGQTTTSTSLSICQDCSNACLTCKDSVTTCTSCKDGQYLSSGTCSSCDLNCLTCSGTAKTCVTCSSGSYLVSASNTCSFCSASCKTCKDSATFCTSCKTGLYLSGSNCMECDSNCGECLTTKTNCTGCKIGFYLTGSSCTSCNSNCYTCSVQAANCTSCTSGKYVSADRVCVACSSSCKECEGSSTLCTACTTGLVLVNDKCGVCNSTCDTCSGDFNTCGSCKGTHTLINGICAPCVNNCKTCANSYSTCTSCEDGRYLINNKCLPCNSNCKSCFGVETNCTSCYSGTSLISGVCEICDSPCLTCTIKKSQCSSCEDGKYLSSNTCFTCDSKCTKCFSAATTCEGCKDGYFLSGNTCTTCSNLCVTCKTSASFCTSCIDGATLKNGACVVNCEPGKMQIGLICEPCSPSCKTCSGAVDQCTSCSSGIVYQNTCVDSCPTGYFVSGGGCQPCASICKECSSKSTTCITCNTGYRLLGETCEFVCPPGQFSNGGVCQQCDVNCNTCYKTSIFCTSCANSTNVLMDDGVCVEPCPSGYLRLRSSEPCEPCSSDCKECSKIAQNCTSCPTSSDMKLYDGNCIPECPQNSTVEVNGKCIDCNAKCKYCEKSPYTCTACPNNTYLYLSTCVDECPKGYQLIFDTCQKCYNPNNCSEVPPSSSSNSSENISYSSNSSSSHEFQGKPVPFPFSGVSILTGGVVAVTKLTSAGVHFVPSTIAVWGVLSFTSWIFLAGYIPDQGDNGNYRRRLADVDAVGGNAVLTVAFFLILGGLIFHVVCNILFSLTYHFKVSKKDKTYAYWKKSHVKVNWMAIILSYIVSFHCIRFLFCGLCNYDGFKVTYENRGKVYKPLIKYGYISILCTFVPIFIAEILILTALDVWLWLWMFTLDSLFLTFFLGILVLIDLKRREKELLRYELEKQLGPLPLEGEELIRSSDSVKDLIDMFPQLDFKSLIPHEPSTKKLIKKGISISATQSPVSSPRESNKGSAAGSSLRRCGSFPLLKHDKVEIRPDELRPPEPVIIPNEEPFGEEILNKSEENDDLTMIVEEVPEVPEEPKEFEVTFTESKVPVSRSTQLSYSPIEIETNFQEFTEIVAFTEEDEPSEEEKIIPIKEEDKEVEEFEAEHIAESPKMSRANLIESSSEESEEKLENSKDLGKVDEEKDLDLEKAVADPKNPELVSVFNKQTGQRMTIRKGFKGARIVNLENKVIDSLPPIDPKKFESGKTVVDDSDVRFATMTAKTGERVRVKRSFKGARIVDLEKKVSHPHAYLIGQSIKNESDFQFSNAYPDPDDPEVVVVMHNETGEDVKVRKTFQGAQIVDEAGEPIPDAPGIDRNDYDIPKTIVDKDDVHLATLKHKITHQKVKVRRTFRGAKIIDLERKAEFPKVMATVSEKSDEPEPLSPSLSNEDILGGDFGWITPAEIKKKSPKHSVKKPPLKPIAVTPKIDESYDRRKLANLANLIDDLEEEEKDWQAEPYQFVSESSDDDRSIRPTRKTLYHNVDLDSVYAPEFRDDIFEPEDFPANERRKPRKKKKKLKKIPNADPARMKGLEDIYLQRLEGKKKTTGPTPMKYTAEPGVYEPEWERTDSVHDFKYTGTLPSAGEEIINPRFKMSTPRRGL